MPTPLRIAITPGEPAGIGPELVVKLAQRSRNVELLAVADPNLIEQYAQQLGLNIRIRLTDGESPPETTRAGEIACIPLRVRNAVTPGKLDVANAAYVIESLTLANKLALTNKVQAIVTGPVQKSVINDAGIPFSGHTEFFAENSATDKVVMMLATGSFRVALATTHLPLREVSSAITKDSLEQILRILNGELQRKFGLKTPNILICGLNPHAGEGGHMGREEIEVLHPVIENLRKDGMKLSDPLPADTLFTPKHLEHADAVLAMYHDQGLPVLKYQGFGRAVNITLGLPYIRTSVDHGTALDLSGKGIADSGSLEVALDQAIAMANSTRIAS